MIGTVFQVSLGCYYGTPGGCWAVAMVSWQVVNVLINTGCYLKWKK